MKDNVNKHLPVIGIGPIIVIPQLLITTVAIIMSERKKIFFFQIESLKIPFIIIGIVLIIFGIWMWFSSNFISKIDGHIKENKLVTTGVYAIVRNPIYSAFFLVCTGAFFIESNIILFVFPIIYYVYMTLILLKTEEKWLYKLYRSEYEDYCRNVNRFIPWKKKKIIKMPKL